MRCNACRCAVAMHIFSFLSFSVLPAEALQKCAVFWYSLVSSFVWGKTVDPKLSTVLLCVSRLEVVEQISVLGFVGILFSKSVVPTIAIYAVTGV
ncbi:hypothetical protein BDV25DRAFT_163471 [Aspergillus avenaceus]|uniref:Secreted protein n=1 Tax=Aspergillus avenaceus TaxID=36643 RepID=A0A5N6TI18_ASPAV|nr:hypothetical protein BDV25DRAFT_163471 [Aspergillus avenaceus]